MKIENIIKTLSKTNNKSTFIGINDYTSNAGTTKNYLINFHADYKSAVEKSVIQMFKFEPSNEKERIAKEEILSSLRNSFESVSKMQDVFVGNNKVKGLVKNGDKIFITGFLLKQNIDAKTVKQKIFATLPISKFRQFELNPSKMKSIIVNGKKIKL